MDELMDMMMDDASASQISDKIKDLLYAKSAERVDGYRPDAANSLFGSDEIEDESSDEVETPENSVDSESEEEEVAVTSGEI